jgi:cob(I)alamin adenosyltransferase
MNIYTKAGDDQLTSLARGTRILKDDIRMEAIGTIDELNAFIGLLSSSVFVPYLEKIQRDLFAVGAYFADENSKESSVTPKDILGLEHEIDLINSQLEPLTCFILPRGGQAASLCHVCRTVCRRAERRMVSYFQVNHVEPDQNILIYINRLSDYFFVLARHQQNLVEEREMNIHQ